MNLQEVREAYYEYSGKLSDINRQLNFAGIAVIWVIKVGKESIIPFSECLLWSLGLNVCSMALDLFHYICSTTIWGIFGRYKEVRLDDHNSEFLAPRYFNWPAVGLLGLKVLFTIISYCIVILYIGKHLLS